MAKISCRISVTGSAHIDLSTLVIAAFIECEILAFHLKDKLLHDMFNSNYKALSEDEIIQTLETKFWSLKSQVLCIPD